LPIAEAARAPVTLPLAQLYGAIFKLTSHPHELDQRSG
jgi:hypothetical protein